MRVATRGRAARDAVAGGKNSVTGLVVREEVEKNERTARDGKARKK